MKRITNLFAALALLFVMAMPVLKAAADTTTNLIANPSVSTANAGQPANWTSSSWGANTTNFSYLTNSGHGDTTSLYISMNAHTDGDAKWVPDAASVTSGQSYTFSDWYMANTASELDAEYIAANGSVSYAYLGAAAASSAWKQATATFSVPAGVAKVAVLHILYNTGWLQTDDFSLAAPVTVPPAGNNLIANASFAAANGTTPANWSKGSWGTNDAQFIYDTAKGHTDTSSATITMTTHTNGDAKWYADPVAVTAGQTYTYSDWYQSNATTQVMAAFIDASGNYTYLGLNDAAASSAWAQYSANLVIPAAAKQVTFFHLLGTVGTLTIDDVSLSPSTPTQELVPNGSVETANTSNTTLPLNWSHNKWGTNTTSFSYLATGGHTGSRAVQTKTTAYTNGDAKWYFASVAVTPDTQYRFSDWYKATTATEVDVAFTMSDGSTAYEMIGLPDASTNTWANFTTTFSVPLGAQTMTVFHLLHAVGTLTLDDESLKAYSPVAFNRALVTLTFDDSYASTYTNGLPLLQKYGFLSTQFVITGNVNTPNYMTTAQVQSLYRAGHEIGSHTVTHPDMLTQTPTQWTQELANSQTQLQQWIGAPVTSFAFPEGLYNGAILTQAKRYYATTRGVEAGFNGKDTFNAYDIKVQNVDQATTSNQVADWVKQAQATKTWLVLVFHSVDPDTSVSSYNVTPTQLDTHLNTIKSSGIPVVTMQQALAELKPQL